MQVLTLICVFCISMTAAIVAFLAFRISRDQHYDYDKRAVEEIEQYLIGKKAITFNREIISIKSLFHAFPTLIPDLEKNIEKAGCKIVPLENVKSIEGVSEKGFEALKNLKDYWFKPRFVFGKVEKAI